jgi:hypothetical protein
MKRTSKQGGRHAFIERGRESTGDICDASERYQVSLGAARKLDCDESEEDV